MAGDGLPHLVVAVGTGDGVGGTTAEFALVENRRTRGAQVATREPSSALMKSRKPSIRQQSMLHWNL